MTRTTACQGRGGGSWPDHERPWNRARTGVLAAFVLGLLLVPASAQADPVTAQGCTQRLERSGTDRATFRFNCGFPAIIVQVRTNKRATVTPPFLTTGGIPTYACLDPTSGPGDAINPTPFTNSFGCQIFALTFAAQGTLRVSDPCGREKLRITHTLLAINGRSIPNDVQIQGCPAERPPRRPPRPPEPTEAPCTISGSASSNDIKGTSGDDVICAGAGNDVVRARGGNDIVRGGPGPDVLRGEAGRDELFGGPGRDDCRTDAQDIQHGC